MAAEKTINLNGEFARELEKKLSEPLLTATEEVERAKKILRAKLRERLKDDSDEEIEEEVEEIIKSWQEPILP